MMYSPETLFYGSRGTEPLSLPQPLHALTQSMDAVLESLWRAAVRDLNDSGTCVISWSNTLNAKIVPYHEFMAAEGG